METPPPVGGGDEADGEADRDIDGNFLLKDPGDWSDSHCACCLQRGVTVFGGVVGVLWKCTIFAMSCNLSFFLLAGLVARDCQPITAAQFR